MEIVNERLRDKPWDVCPYCLKLGDRQPPFPFISHSLMVFLAVECGNERKIANALTEGRLLRGCRQRDWDIASKGRRMAPVANVVFQYLLRAEIRSPRQSVL
jgi:hypothetical protein